MFIFLIKGFIDIGNDRDSFPFTINVYPLITLTSKFSMHPGENLMVGGERHRCRIIQKKAYRSKMMSPCVFFMKL